MTTSKLAMEQDFRRAAKLVARAALAWCEPGSRDWRHFYDLRDKALCAAEEYKAAAEAQLALVADLGDHVRYSDAIFEETTAEELLSAAVNLQTARVGENWQKPAACSIPDDDWFEHPLCAHAPDSNGHACGWCPWGAR